MDLKQLGYFVAIAEEGSISAAAKKLHISQPPLSQQLKLLETELGVKLVERGARRATLTDAGTLLYKRASTILGLADAAVRELEDFGEKPFGMLRLGTTSSSGPALLKRRITQYAAVCPGVRFEIHEGNTFQLIELLANGTIDVAVARTPFHAENTDHFALESEPMIACGQKTFFAGLQDERISLKDLKGRPVILYRRFEKLILSACKAEGFKPNVYCLNDDARTSLMWANAGLGVAIVPQSMQPYAHGCASRVLAERSIQSQVTAIWRNDRYLPAAAKTFLEVFKK
ncbi:MAG TPA: LysR family transcriptional regulator [Caproiciproducens sp.]|nr:LysR family transcriptional regulator [Caproiciproducens sp.]